MKPVNLVPTVLRAPFPARSGMKLTPRLLFATGLSLAAASQMAAADPAVSLPSAGALPLDFRCFVGEITECPLDGNDRIFFQSSPKYLQFDATEDTECGYPPFVTNEAPGAFVDDGIGVGSICVVSDSAQIDSEAPAQQLLIDIREFLGEGSIDSSAAVEGIYLFPLTSTTFGVDGFLCLPDDTGEVRVFVDGEEGPLTFPYTSDTSQTEGGFCNFDGAEGAHAIFVDFGERPFLRLSASFERHRSVA